MKSIWALSFLMMVGCASVPMDVIQNQNLHTTGANESQIVFMRSNLVSSLLTASLYEIRGDKIEFLGILSDSTKIALKTTPGEHFYMVVSKAADFLRANLSPGKTYYSIVTPRIGGWKPRFSLWPLSTNPNAKYNTSDEDLEQWLEETTLVTLSESSLAWYEQYKHSIDQKRVAYLLEWYALSEAEKAEHSLKPQDGL